MKPYLKKIFIFLLHRVSSLVLRKYKPKIIGITGSVGKTSTKDAVYTALSNFENVRRSPKSFNSELGIPLTILEANNPGNDPVGWLKVLLEGIVLLLFPSPYPKWLVLEVGTDRPGDIGEITKWLKPDIVIVTRLAKVPVHVEAFGTPERLYEEKGKLVQSVKPGGIVILNADDENVLKYRELTEEKVILFGCTSGTSISAANYHVTYGEDKLPTGIAFDVFANPGIDNHPITVNIFGTLGEQHIYHVLTALAVIKHLGENLVEAAESLAHESKTPGRMRLIDGINESLIIDDSYNSSPVAVEEALRALKSLKMSSRSARKIAILGDMLELGKYTTEEHKRVGEPASDILKVLATVGIRSRYTAESALKNGMKIENVHQFDESKEAGDFMREQIKKGDIVLVKGSQGVRMERAVEKLMAHPEHKEKLLVRQDKEWKNR